MAYELLHASAANMRQRRIKVQDNDRVLRARVCGIGGFGMTTEAVGAWW